jgi:polyhydroxybutyrate depolymerase
MKYTTILLLLIGFAFSISAQQTINGSMIHDGIQRDYILYIPAIYDGNTDVPLILNFHGFGSNANQQLVYGDFRDIADKEGFLLVHPEGTLLNGNQHWNVGSFTIGSTTDDVSFTEALIDELANQYAINLVRVYATGMSNGGYMSFLLACKLS